MTDIPIADLADTLARVLHPEYNAVPLADAILAVDKLLAQIEEARMWARHGYEIGQRSNTWSDHGVAPTWLTENQPSTQLAEAGPDDGFRWHVLSECADEAAFPIHGRNEEPAVKGQEDVAVEPDVIEVHQHKRDYGQGDAWMWRCNGTWWCTGWVGLDLGSETAARAEADRHVRENHHDEPTEQQLHAQRACPGWEYATTEGQRKQWDDADRPPSDENGDPDPTWERNVDAGRDGWERFDYTEESYWRRPATEPKSVLTPEQLARLDTEGVDTTGCDCGHEGMGAAWHRDWCAWRKGKS